MSAAYWSLALGCGKKLRLFLPFAFNLFLDFLPHSNAMPIQKPLKAADRSDCVKIVENRQTYKQRESITPNEATAQE